MKKLKNYFKIGRAAWNIVKDPTRLDQVLVVSDALIEPRSMEPVLAAYRSDSRTKDALEKRPRLANADLNELAKKPEGTLGQAFAVHMLGLGFKPEDIKFGRESENSPESYVAAHLYETHDIWHVVTGFGTDEAGELGLQAFYAAQAPTPFPTIIIALGLLNAFFFARQDAGRRFAEISRGYAMGKTAEPFFGRDWDQLWDKSLTEVRKSLNIELEDSQDHRVQSGPELLLTTNA